MRESAARFNVSLYVIGNGKEYPAGTSVYNDLSDYIKTLDCEYVLLTDSYDVMIVRWDEEEVIRAVDSSLGNLLVAAHDDLWPRGPWMASYPVNGTPWRCANGGQIAGTKESILWLCDQFTSNKWPVAATGGGNQEMLHRMHAAGVPFTVDTSCSIFQTLRGPSRLFVALRDGIVFNTVTNSIPMFLHFAGGQPGLADWFKRLYGLDPVNYERVRGRRPVIEVGIIYLST